MLRIVSLSAGLALAVGLLLSAAQSATAAEELHLYNWSNYFPPSLQDKFEQETGIKVTMDNYASEEDLLAKNQRFCGIVGETWLCELHPHQRLSHVMDCLRCNPDK